MATQKEIKAIADDAEEIRATTNRSLGDAIWAALDKHHVTLNAHLRKDYYRLVRKECDSRKGLVVPPQLIQNITNAVIRLCAEKKRRRKSAIWTVIRQHKITRDEKLMSAIYDGVQKEFDLRKISSASAKERKAAKREYLEQHQLRLL